LEVPKILTRIARNEKTTVINFFEREVRRLVYIQERKKIRLQEKGGFEAALQAKPKSDENSRKPGSRATHDPSMDFENEYVKIFRE
jgi:hypothetical protein